MSVFVTYPESREAPAEVEYTHPVECVVCEEVWDVDDHLGEYFHFFEGNEGQPVCYGQCTALLEDSLDQLSDEDEFASDVIESLEGDVDFEEAA